VLTGVTNRMSESLNRIAKLEARLAYSFRNPVNQQRRVRMACTRSARRSQNLLSHQSHPVTSQKHDPGY
jgi:transposase